MLIIFISNTYQHYFVYFNELGLKSIYSTKLLLQSLYGSFPNVALNVISYNYKPVRKAIWTENRATYFNFAPQLYISHLRR